MWQPTPTPHNTHPHKPYHNHHNHHHLFRIIAMSPPSPHHRSSSSSSTSSSSSPSPNHLLINLTNLIHLTILLISPSSSCPPVDIHSLPLFPGIQCSQLSKSKVQQLQPGNKVTRSRYWKIENNSWTAFCIDSHWCIGWPSNLVKVIFW